MWTFLTVSVVGLVVLISGSLAFANSVIKLEAKPSPEEEIKLKETEARIQKEKEERERAEKDAYDEKIRKDEEAKKEAEKKKNDEFLQSYPDDASFAEAKKYIAFLCLVADDIYQKNVISGDERTFAWLSTKKAWLIFNKYNKKHPELMTCFVSKKGSDGNEFLFLGANTRADLEKWAKGD